MLCYFSGDEHSRFFFCCEATITMYADRYRTKCYKNYFVMYKLPEAYLRIEIIW